MPFDKEYVLLRDMIESDYYPKKSVKKIIGKLKELIDYLETGVTDINSIQEKLDTLTDYINELEDEFYENDSEIETVARESIGETIDYILKYFRIEIDIETAIRNREW